MAGVSCFDGRQFRAWKTEAGTMGQTKAQTANYSYVLIDEENRILVDV